MWGSNPSLSGQSSGFWVSFPLSDSGVAPVLGWAWWGDCVSASPTPFHVGGLPALAHGEELPIQVSVFFRGSGSRCSCRFGVFRGGGDQDPFMSPSGTGTLSPSSFFKRVKCIGWHWLIAEDGVTLGGGHAVQCADFGPQFLMENGKVTLWVSKGMGDLFWHVWKCWRNPWNTREREETG